jgi:O-acetylhomoserine (thiol)-lyase
MDGHAVQIGGVIVDSGKFDWTRGKFPGLTEPDDSYHGVSYVRDFGKAAYITKARVQLMRDLGSTPTAMAAFLLNLGLETLPVRIERHCRNAEKVAEFLAASPKVEFVNYPRLKTSPYFERAKKYLPNGTSGVIGFSIRGGRENAVRFMDSLKLASNVVHVADIRTCVLHPASATHRQMTDEQLSAAGITPGLIRLSVGLENIDDILEDIAQALAKV